MFRVQQNSFDDAVVKATDENLTSEDWALILDVCDKVQASETGSKDVVAAMIKRLAHRNANVQLYTLELANALSQNCGIALHRELASRSFTDTLLRIAGDRTTHQQVKSKILERIEEWTKMFSENPELGIMEQAYNRLKATNPNLQPPQAPTKLQITQYDRQKEEEELQMALRLSIQDRSTPKQENKPAELPGQSSSSATTSPPAPSLPSGTTAATVSRVRALYDFQPTEAGELQFRKGDVIAVIESVYKDWWKGSLRGQEGIFPLNYVEKLQDPTQDELQREAETEAEVFGQIKNVEKLLALLSTSATDHSSRDNDEVTELYHGTLAIRPKLIELINKYSQKKDDLQQLNEKFIKARRDYEALLEVSMAQSAQQYGRPMGYGAMPNQNYPSPRYYTQDGQPPNNGIPAQYGAPAAPAMQAPYPISSPPPQSHTPVSRLQPPQDGHPGYPASIHSVRPTSTYDLPNQAPYGAQEFAQQGGYDGPSDLSRFSYPPAQAPGVQQTQGQYGTDPAKEYSPSIYSHDDRQTSQAQYGQPQQSQYPSIPGQPPSQYPLQPSSAYHTQSSLQQMPPQPSQPPPSIPDAPALSQTPVNSSGYMPFSAAQPGQGPAGYQPYQSQGQPAGNPANFYR